MPFLGMHRGPFWREFDQLRREMDRLHSVASQGSRVGFAPMGRGALFPLLNVKESPREFVITAEIPGISGEDLDISVEGSTVTLKGERRPDDFGTEASYHRRERTSGSFQRCLTLPSKVDPDRVKAHYRKGVLTLTLAKPVEAQPRQIAVESE
ncbi:MAG: Hsp20/alpha crystallin family protein [Thermodesulfobacteriota bacterium]